MTPCAGRVSIVFLMSWFENAAIADDVEGGVNVHGHDRSQWSYLAVASVLVWTMGGIEWGWGW